MKKCISNKYFWICVGFLALIIIWFIISMLVDESQMIFPGPADTIVTMFNLLKSQYTYKCIGSTFCKMIIGFAISFLNAMIFGTVAGNFSKIKHILVPLISLLKSVPTAAVVFLFLVVFGVKNAPIVMVILISFPILYEAVVRGIENISRDIVDATSLENVNFVYKVFRVQIPQIAPYIFVGVASSISLSFKIEIMAEIIAGDTGYGLGSAILSAQRNHPTDLRELFAYSFIAVVFVFLFGIVLKIIEAKIKDKL